MLHQDLFTTADRRRVYVYVSGVALKALIGVCLYIAVAKYILDIHALDSERSFLALTLLIIGFVWLLFTLFFASGLFAIYIKRIIRFPQEKKGFTKLERHIFGWTALLLFAAICFSNPVQLVAYVAKLANSSWKPPAALINIPAFVCETIFFTTLLFYAWCMVHGFRLREEESWSTVWFYIPKILLVGLLLVSKFVAAFAFRLYLSSLPFASFFSMINIEKPLSITNFQSSAVLAITILEAVFIIAVAVDFARTYAEMRRRSDRIQMLRIKFFAHRFAITMLGMYIGYLGLQYFLSNAKFGKQLVGNTKSTFLLLTRQEAMMVFMAYSLIEAFLNLPGMKYSLFMLRSEDTLVKPQPVSYTDGYRHYVTYTNEFVCERTVELLNLNFATYYLSSRLVNDSFDIKQALRHEGYKVFGKTTSENPNSCKAFVYINEEELKVIICIVGPTEFEANSLKKPKQETIDHCTTHILQAQQRRSKKEASIHQGFVLLYAEIAQELNHIVEKAMQEFEGERMRLLFTGYSLGGAVAALASLDIAIRNALPGADTIVEIFGAPRVGNKAFVSFYNYRLPNHWRVITDGDIVAQMPGTKYFPVGLDAVLTDQGQLAIDPTSILPPRSHGGKRLSPVQKAARHKRIAYLLALRSWTRQHRAHQYQKVATKRLWDWPIEPEDMAHLPSYGLQKTPEKTV